MQTNTVKRAFSTCALIVFMRCTHTVIAGLLENRFVAHKKTRHHQDFHLDDAWFMFSNPVRQMPYISNFRGLLFYDHPSKGPQPLMLNPALTAQGELPRRGKRRPPGGARQIRKSACAARLSMYEALAAPWAQEPDKKARKSGLRPLFRHTERALRPFL